MNGISWKVADAKRAGISPLAALGASTNSFSNVVGGEGKLGEAVGEMGQDLGRAASATLSANEKMAQSKSIALDLEKKGLENDLLRTELASKLTLQRAAGTPNGVPGPNIVAPGSAGSGAYPPVNIVAPKVEDEKQANQYRVWGVNTLDDPWTSDAQHFENIFGDNELASMAHTAMKVPSWLAYNWKQWYEAQRRLRGLDQPGAGRY